MKIIRRHLFYRRKDSNPCVVDKNIKTTKFGHRQLEQGFNLRMNSDIANYSGDDALTQGRQSSDRLIDLASTPGANTNIHAFLHQSFRYTEANSFSSASSDCNFAR